MILTPAQRICRIIIYNMQSPHTAADVYSVHETAAHRVTFIDNKESINRKWTMFIID